MSSSSDDLDHASYYIKAGFSPKEAVEKAEAERARKIEAGLEARNVEAGLEMKRLEVQTLMFSLRAAAGKLCFRFWQYCFVLF